MSPKSKRELARQHLETARADLEGERNGDALNAMFHAAEAAVVWLADSHAIDTRRKHWAKADAAERLYELGVTTGDHGELLRELNQGRKGLLVRRRGVRARGAHGVARRGRAVGHRRGEAAMSATAPHVTDLLQAWETDAAWHARLEDDRRRAERSQSAEQRRITETLLLRACDMNVEAFALTGSTVRDRRTEISDLDYHVIGPAPASRDLADEVDIVATDAARFWDKLRAGDDYIQWTLRYGCILLDRTGIFRSALRTIAEEELWPDTTRKRARLPSHRLHAERLIAVGDRDAAQEQVRAALTSAARATLLDAGVFPLARDELPGQLRSVGWDALADALHEAIHDSLSLPSMTSRLSAVDDAIRDRPHPPLVNERHVVGNAAGGWDVVRPGSPRVSSRHRTQREAVTRARQIVGNSGGGDVVVHARDGRIRDRDTIGPPAFRAG